MKFAKSMVVLCAVGGAFGAVAAQAAAVAPEKVMTCAEAKEKFQPTAEAQARFAHLQGSCEGIYKINDALYAHVTATVRKVGGGKVTLYLPATDRTVEVTPKPELRVNVDGKMIKPSALRKGDTIDMYLSLDRFAEGKPAEIVMPAPEPAAPEAVAPVAAEEVAALPTTASELPALALLSALLLGVGFTARRIRRSA